MKTINRKIASKLLSALFCLIFFVPNIPAQNIAEIDFDPKIDGFSFKNYGNDKTTWEDDLDAEDMIRLFGAKGACKSGTTAKDCVLKEAAARWLKESLKAMEIGHCEGISVASLRMKNAMPFKKRLSPHDFQPNTKSPFGLKLAQPMENYIAYYWITQRFDEVTIPTQEMAEAGPVEIAKALISSFETEDEIFTLGLNKLEKNFEFDGHTITPFAVEETTGQYKIHVYDNNFPGETRFLYINKTGNQQWTYNGTDDPKAKPDYTGDKTTQTLDITATSWREGKCFNASFVKGRDLSKNCGTDIARLENPFFTNISFNANPKTQNEVEDVEFFLTGDGEMLVTDGNGDRIGYDPKTDTFYDEISDGISEELVGGLGIDLPHFTFPYEESPKPYEIVFSGKYLDEESTLDFVFSAPGFTVGFSDLRLDPNETLTATISSDGEEISFTASKDGETPEVFYAFDPEKSSDASYLTIIEGVQLTGGKQLFYNFDFENGKLFFSDNDGNEDSYDIELIRILANGTRQIYTQSDLNIGKTDSYEMDFGSWDGKGKMCFKDDEDGDGFADEECTEEADDNTEGEFDNER